MDHAAFQSWLDRYIDAWRLLDPVAIGDLFSPDARYAFDPFSEAVVGRAAIVAAWLTDPDEPGSWEADYEVLAIDGDTCVSHGRTRYLTDDRATVDREFANVVVRFDDEGRRCASTMRVRCRDFTEWYMRKRPDAGAEKSLSGTCVNARMRFPRSSQRCTLPSFDPDPLR